MLKFKRLITKKHKLQPAIYATTPTSTTVVRAMSARGVCRFLKKLDQSKCMTHKS